MNMRGNDENVVARHIDMLCCPKCRGALEAFDHECVCINCKSSYVTIDGIPRMYASNDWENSKNDVTDRMKAFYEETPFPNYDNFDSTASLIRKAKEGVFAKLLDEQVPFRSTVLEAGCGTGQLTNFLSVANRDVFGTDICMNSLTLAENFKQKNDLHRAHFMQMNLFRPCFRDGVFDLVISNGVLHHTSDPYLAFKSLADLVKLGGHIVIGLYHRFGRLATDLRRTFFRLSNDKLKVLDPRNMNPAFSEGKRTAWFRDQYKNPHESKHTILEVIGWLDSIGLQFVKSIPKTKWFQDFQPDERLFEQDQTGNRLGATLKEMSMALRLSQIKEGGFFVIIGKKPTKTLDSR